MSLSLASILAESARRFEERIAVVDGPARISYGELWRDSRRYAAALAELGIGPGDRVAMMVPSVADFPRVYYAILALGAVVVPVHLLFTPADVAYVLGDSGAKALVYHEALAPLAGRAAQLAEVRAVGVDRLSEPETGSPEPIAAIAERAADDPAVILYTSGTTGRPKGAVLTQLNLFMNATVCAFDCHDTRQGDVVLGCLPLFHSYGQSVAMNSVFRRGATVVLQARFDPAAAIGLMVRERVDIFVGVPTMYIALIEAAAAAPTLPSLRFAVSGGSSLPETVLHTFEKTFSTVVYEGYGLSETSPVATTNHAFFERRVGTVGQPIWGVEVEIARADLDREVVLVPRGELGEVVIRGHNVFAGYLNRPEETASTLIDGWLRTGDLGTKSADGYVSILDRKKDIIIRGAFNVYPREVEEALLRHPDIAQVSVIGIPDQHYGEEVCAVVVPTEHARLKPEQVVEWAREHVGRHAYPRRVEVVDELPLGPSMKVLKRELRRVFTPGEPS